LFEAGVRVPKVEKVDYERMVLTMEFLEGFRSVKELLREGFEDLQKLGFLIGVQIGKVHENGVIHGDLTSSNIMVKIMGNEYEVAIIDFGLSQVSKSQEHRAVDLSVFEKSLLCEEGS
jgi:TP53 regulating kinase-like protein